MGLYDISRNLNLFICHREPDCLRIVIARSPAVLRDDEAIYFGSNRDCFVPARFALRSMAGGSLAMTISTMINYFFSFLIGSVVGSFVNMAVFRLHHDVSFQKKRSFCDYCGKLLSWKDLIPVVSFIFSKGVTRCCHKRLSVSYPMAEFSLGVLFAFSYAMFFPDSMLMTRAWFFLVIITLVVVLDARFYMVHVGVVLLPLPVVILLNIFSGFSAWNMLEGAFLGAGFYALQYGISRGKWVGQGDIWLGLLFGVMFGLSGMLILLFFAYILGALVGIAFLVSGKLGLKSRLPMGAFLGGAGLITLFFSDTIAAYYWSLIL